MARSSAHSWDNRDTGAHRVLEINLSAGNQPHPTACCAVGRDRRVPDAHAGGQRS